MGFLIGLILWCSLCGGLGYAVAGDDKKGLGAMLGVLLGPLGILIAAIACRK